MRNKTKQRFSIIVLAMWLVLLTAHGWAINESMAQQIAENVAGCSPANSDDDTELLE